MFKNDKTCFLNVGIQCDIIGYLVPGRKNEMPSEIKSPLEKYSSFDLTSDSTSAVSSESSFICPSNFSSPLKFENEKIKSAQNEVMENLSVKVTNFWNSQNPKEYNGIQENAVWIITLL